jgi:hypothetical protein
VSTPHADGSTQAIARLDALSRSVDEQTSAVVAESRRIGILGRRTRRGAAIVALVAELERRSASMQSVLETGRTLLRERLQASPEAPVVREVRGDVTQRRGVGDAAQGFLRSLAIGDRVVDEVVLPLLDGERWEDTWIDAHESVRDILDQIVAADGVAPPTPAPAAGRSGGGPTALDHGGRSELHYAAGRTGGGVDRLRELLAEGYDVDLPDRRGFTPLFFAAEGAQPEQARALLDAGADIEARDAWGNTALGRAILVPDPAARQVARILLEAGADPDSKNDYDRSARDVVNDIVNQELRELFAQFPPLDQR